MSHPTSSSHHDRPKPITDGARHRAPALRPGCSRRRQVRDHLPGDGVDVGERRRGLRDAAAGGGCWPTDPAVETGRGQRVRAASGAEAGELFVARAGGPVAAAVITTFAGPVTGGRTAATRGSCTGRSSIDDGPIPVSAESCWPTPRVTQGCGRHEPRALPVAAPPGGDCAGGRGGPARLEAGPCHSFAGSPRHIGGSVLTVVRADQITVAGQSSSSESGRPIRSAATGTVGPEASFPASSA